MAITKISVTKNNEIIAELELEEDEPGDEHRVKISELISSGGLPYHDMTWDEIINWVRTTVTPTPSN